MQNPNSMILIGQVKLNNFDKSFVGTDGVVKEKTSKNVSNAMVFKGWDGYGGWGSDVEIAMGMGISHDGEFGEMFLRRRYNDQSTTNWQKLRNFFILGMNTILHWNQKVYWGWIFLYTPLLIPTKKSQKVTKITIV